MAANFNKLKALSSAKRIAERWRAEYFWWIEKIYSLVETDLKNLFETSERLKNFVKDLLIIRKKYRRSKDFRIFSKEIISLIEKRFCLSFKYITTYSVTRHSNGYRLIDLDSFEDISIDKEELFFIKREIVHLFRKEEEKIKSITYKYFYLPIYNIVNNDILWVVVLKPCNLNISNFEKEFLFNLVFFTLNDLIYNIFLARKDKIIASERLDDLTKLYKKKYIETKIVELLVWWKDFVLLMLDLDKFKKINDDFGHLMGDNILKAFGVALRKSIKWNIDFPSRWGWEEFLILLDGDIIEKNKIQLNDILRQIVLRIYDNFVEELQKQNINLKVTFSGGISISSECSWILNLEDQKRTILKLSDDRLYKAKQDGRAKVILPDWTAIKLWK